MDPIERIGYEIVRSENGYYSPDGQCLYNSSIGVISLPQWLEWAKGPASSPWWTRTRSRSSPRTSSTMGCAPAVFTPDNQTMYAQLSYFNGLDADQRGR